MVPKNELSIILIPAHAQRVRLIHKSLLNIRASLAKEVHVTIYAVKSPDVAAYFTKHKDCTITYVNELPMWRDKVSSNPCLIINEGSLFSPSWLPSALKASVEQPDAIFHTEQTIFTNKSIVWNKESSDQNHVLLSLVVHNQWDYPAVTNAKNLPKKYPLEDQWGFNEQTLSRGISHRVVKDSVHFSKLTPDFNKSNNKIEYAAFYDSELYRGLQTSYIKEGAKASTSLRLKLPSKEILRRIHVSLKRRSKLYASIVMPVIQGLAGKSIGRIIAPWSIDAWKQVHQFDRTIFPTKDSLHALTSYSSIDVKAGKIFLSLLQQLSTDRNTDYLFISQHMMKGGGDKVVLNYINTLRAVKPDWKISLIVSEPFNNTWEDRIPPAVTYGDFGNETASINPVLKHRLLAKLIVQSGTRRFMLAMTPFGFEVIEQFKETFNHKDYQIDAVAFCSDTDLAGRTWGIHFFGIPENFDSLHRIMTDNAQVIDETLALEPLSRDKFVVHYQPVSFDQKTPTIRKGRKKDGLKILWASRIANQKRPDIVIKIAKKLHKTGHHIDLYGTLEDDYSERDFIAIDNISYKGSFDGFNTLPLAEYDVFLYTSSFDGVPNVLLEASASGLPVIAPNVGGIREFIINKKTGLLIDDIENIDAFVKAINFLAENPKSSLEFIFQAQKLINTQHSQKRFAQAVKKDFTE